MPRYPDTLVTIDPGLARLGWAAFDTTGLTLHPRATLLRGRLLRFGSVSSDPHAPTEARLASMLDALGHALVLALPDADPGATAVIIERPAVGGAYFRNKQINFAAIASGIADLHLSIGSIAGWGIASGFAVGFRHPNTMGKTERWDRCKLAFGPAVATTTNPEERDAVWLGVQVMLDGRRKWAEGDATPRPDATTPVRLSERELSRALAPDGLQGPR